MGDQLNIFVAVPEINEHGVMDDDWSGVETLSDVGRRGKTPNYGWTIRLAQFPDGLWRSAAEYMTSTSGCSSPLCATWPGHPTRSQALEEAIHTLRYRMAREPVNALTKRIVDDMDKLEITEVERRGGEVAG